MTPESVVRIGEIAGIVFDVRCCPSEMLLRADETVMVFGLPELTALLGELVDLVSREGVRRACFQLAFI